MPHVRRRTFWGVLLIVLSLGLLTTALVLAAPGDLDTTFDGDGIVTTDFGTTATTSDVAIQADGKIGVAGGSDGKFALARYNSTGTLDTTFDGDGLVTTTIGTSAEGIAVAIQSDGKIVVSGGISAGLAEEFALARYNSDGSLDTTFDGNGIVTIDLADAFAHDVAIQADGKIVAVGGSDGTFSLARFNSTGTLDSTFDGDGKVFTAIGTAVNTNAVAIQSDGKIVVAGGSDGKFALARYNSTGTLDSTFDGDGLVTTTIGTSAEGGAVAIQSDGKIVVSGGVSAGLAEEFALARYNSDGSLDTTFDGDGIVTIDLADAFAHDVAIHADGKIAAVGGSNGSFALARFNSNGSLDTTFDGDGKVFTAIGAGTDTDAVAIQSDGKIVVAGTSSGDFALARYDGGTITGSAVTLSDTAAGAQTAGTVAFTLANPVPSGQIIVLTFPAGWTVFNGSMTATNWTGLDGATPTSVTGDAAARTVTIVLSAEQTTLSETLTILASVQLVNPSTTGTGLTLFIDATGQSQGTSGTFSITAAPPPPPPPPLLLPLPLPLPPPFPPPLPLPFLRQHRSAASFPSLTTPMLVPTRPMIHLLRSAS